MDMARIIAYLCSAESHTERKLTRSTENLTIHKGEWAVCSSALAEGHEWRKVPHGLIYEELFEMKRPSEKRA